MGTKEKILQKIHNLITTKFKSAQEAFYFYDKDKDGSLNRDEIKTLLKAAEISGLLRGVVAGELIKGYDKSGDEAINLEEFKVAITELERDL
ncbi:EF-hand domain-containing protein [Polaribacter batillariae]|uniref:EF-hand domain-containing protein n=1 Tax=Polaribacter batillariae TaxID=2808900 RepID=A0ABX7SY42_9FLAO|nr:EF-hand domain-containing protein [Polaribacter batillariae]QTD39174.1 EF-hand domain-containing protein [Polaribacter batillariae]